MIVLRLYHILGFWRIRLLLPRPRTLGQHAHVHAFAEGKMAVEMVVIGHSIILRAPENHDRRRNIPAPDAGLSTH